MSYLSILLVGRGEGIIMFELNENNFIKDGKVQIPFKLNKYKQGSRLYNVKMYKLKKLFEKKLRL